MGGAYLSKPNREKETTSGCENGLSWCASAMQGWRIGMEDAHVTLPDMGGELAGFALFGVFDGHGGTEVARFCRAHLPQEFQRCLNRVGGEQTLTDVNVGRAFTSCFHHMDDFLRDPAYEQEIASLSGEPAVPNLSCDDITKPASKQGEHFGGVAQVQSKLHAVVGQSLAKAHDTGTLNKAEAARLAMGITLLQKLEIAQARVPDGKLDSGPKLVSSGCTAVCVALTPTHIICANAGDSRAILCRGGGVVTLSSDHKPNNEAERKRIHAAGGFIKEQSMGTPGTANHRITHRVCGQLSLSRAIGDLHFKTRPDLRPDQQIVCSTPELCLEPRSCDDEFIVLACDGIWDVKTSRQVCEFVRTRLRTGQEVSQIAEELLNSCICKDPKKANGLGADNMTCIIVLLKDPEEFRGTACSCMPFGCFRL